MSEIFKQKTYFILLDDECVKKFNKDAGLILFFFSSHNCYLLYCDIFHLKSMISTLQQKAMSSFSTLSSLLSPIV